MKITLKPLLMVGAILVTMFANAQSAEERAKIVRNYNLDKLNGIAKQYEDNFNKNYAEAMRLAQINNWPLTVKKDGATQYLMDVTKEGTPIYYTSYNVGAAQTIRANRLHPGGSLGLSLTGSGMYVGVWDGEYPRTSHVDFVNRFTTQDGPGVPIALHPTHVLGTIIGAGANNANARGIAYQAYGYINNYANDLGEMTTQSSFGLLLSNHSYGFVASMLPDYYFGAYTDKSAAVDNIAFNAPYYQPVVAAGNDGDGNYDHLTGMGTAKNTIVVAAVAQVSSYTGPSSVSLAGFSNWGPTDDFRIKPDISSKGLAVLSASNLSNTSYVSNQGTSMAAPGITGALLLLQQYYGNLNAGNYMLSSTVRGLLAHTADEAGASDGPDAKFGWGLMNAEKYAEAIRKKGTESILEENTLTTSQTFTKNVLALGTEPLVVTLSWTDPAGQQSNGVVNAFIPAIVNDLDIKVERNGVTYYPWKLTNSLTAAAIKGVNDVDNIEKVEILVPDAGVYTITVSHKGGLTNGSQPYSLIATGIDADAVMSVNENQKSKFKIYPNPTNSVVNISSELLSGNEEFYMYDLQGRLVKSGKLRTSEAQISIENLNTGIYMLQIKGDGFFETHKIIKK